MSIGTGWGGFPIQIGRSPPLTGERHSTWTSCAALVRALDSDRLQLGAHGLPRCYQQGSRACKAWSERVLAMSAVDRRRALLRIGSNVCSEARCQVSLMARRGLIAQLNYLNSQSPRTAVDPAHTPSDGAWRKVEGDRVMGVRFRLSWVVWKIIPSRYLNDMRPRNACASHFLRFVDMIIENTCRSKFDLSIGY
jgi:hypothetical protein